MVSIVKYEEPLGLVKVNVFSTPELKVSPIDPDPYNWCMCVRCHLFYYKYVNNKIGLSLLGLVLISLVY
jgi:hypothetical protein